MHQKNIVNSDIIIYFDWTARILNHRSFCARLVRKLCVPDTITKIRILIQFRKWKVLVNKKDTFYNIALLFITILLAV